MCLPSCQTAAFAFVSSVPGLEQALSESLGGWIAGQICHWVKHILKLQEATFYFVVFSPYMREPCHKEEENTIFHKL